MKQFSKTIDGIKFKFDIQKLGTKEEWFYHVEAEDHIYLMKLDKNLNWKFKASNVPFWIKKLESKISDIINEHNE
jgi:hypothetical protein